MNTLLNLSDAEYGLGVLKTTRPVVEKARHVWIDQRAINAFAQKMKKLDLPSSLDDSLQWSDGSHRTAVALLLLHSWNFCFWAEPGQQKWTVRKGKKKLNGYRALAFCLQRAIEKDGLALYDPEVLKNMTAAKLSRIFRGKGEIPLFEERLKQTQQLGRVLLERWQGDVSQLLAACEGSAVSLVELIVESFEGFRDKAVYQGHEIVFHKRAQVLVSNLRSALPDEPLLDFHDLEQLTAFADYKIPQVLEAHGILRYSPQLEAQLERFELLPAGDPQEVEIRAAMVWAVELLRRELKELGTEYSASELDHMLWNMGQEPVAHQRPYHRTRTIFY